MAALCNTWRVPLTAAGGRSGVSGASVPRHGGVVLDMTGLAGVVAVDATSGVVEVRPGTYGPELEEHLAGYGLRVGHAPQSFALATVGGWVACRGAGLYSTRYGKIEDMVLGVEVVLADGTVVRTDTSPAAAAGGDLAELFVGSEGTLGIITSVWLRAHPLPASDQRAAWRIASFADGVEICRQIIRSGATPAVLRLYDETETQRSHGGDGTWCALLVLDEGHPAIVGATMAVVADACAAAGGDSLGAGLVEAWLAHRNDTSALQALTRRGFVVDTMEVAAPWSLLAGVVGEVRAAILAVPGARAASVHLSHSYLDGACLYFTFAASPPGGEVEPTYLALWDAAQLAALAAGANISHHHGVGINRQRFVAEAVGSSLAVMQRLKDALDPSAILNPGKLGFRDPFEGASWP